MQVTHFKEVQIQQIGPQRIYQMTARASELKEWGDTGFKPLYDGYPFKNYGNNYSKGGLCHGMSLSATLNLLGLLPQSVEIGPNDVDSDDDMNNSEGNDTVGKKVTLRSAYDLPKQADQQYLQFYDLLVPQNEPRQPNVSIYMKPMYNKENFKDRKGKIFGDIDRMLSYFHSKQFSKHLSQRFEEIFETGKCDDGNLPAAERNCIPESALKEIKRLIKHRYPVLIGMGHKKKNEKYSGHTVLAYEYKDYGDRIELYVYDPNHPQKHDKKITFEPALPALVFYDYKYQGEWYEDCYTSVENDEVYKRFFFLDIEGLAHDILYNPLTITKIECKKPADYTITFRDELTPQMQEYVKRNSRLLLMGGGGTFRLVHDYVDFLNEKQLRIYKSSPVDDVKYQLINTWQDWYGAGRDAWFANDSNIVYSAEGLKKITFVDIKANHWAFNSITELARLRYLYGYPDGTFKPENKVTRAEFVQMAVNAARAKGYDLKRLNLGKQEFKDQDNHWAKELLQTACAEQWLILDEQGRLRPDDPISRDQAAYALWRIIYYPKLDNLPAEKQKELDNTGFIDDNHIWKSFKRAVYELGPNGKKIINGYKGNRFFRSTSDLYLTRAEAAQMIFNVIKKK